MTFRTRTFLAMLVASALALGASTVLVTTSLRRAMLQDIEESLLHEVRLGAELLADRGALADPQQEALILARLIAARVTFIDARGTVVGDSDVEAARLSAVDNHLEREEVQEAARDGIGVATRRSVTTGAPTMYAAARVRQGPVAWIRIGLPLTGVEQRVAELGRLAWIGLAAGLAAAILLTWATSAWLSRRVAAIAALAGRYRQGDFTRPLRDFGRDELGTVARALDDAARDLGTRLQDVARERAHMDAVLQGMVEGAVLINAQGRLVLTNPAVRAMLRLPDAPDGRHFLEVVRHPDIARLMTAALGGERPVPAEVQLDHESRRVFIARAVPVEAERGGGAVLVLHDVTELRQADQMRRDFVANVSHELRTPLTAIRGYVEALMDGPSAPEQSQRFLGIIARHASRMERLVADLLRLARLDARQETITRAAVQLRSLCEGVTTELESTASARDVRCDVAIGEDAAVLSADPAKLHDVLKNLVENAINYSPDGGTVTIATSRVGGDIEISVADRGPGIPEAELPRIFERFYRVDRSRTRDPRDPGGTGLGLSIVKHLVDLHGGRAKAANREGGGAIVSVRIPDTPTAV